jgi:putative nucleotidyltransferase with HDIG domain
MNLLRRPPRLLIKALMVTFGTVAALLIVTFLFVRMSVRDQVRRTIADNLDHSQRTVAALEKRRQRELRAQAATLAENPTLKAAVDTYSAEARSGGETLDQLIATIRRELEKLAARIEADAIVLVDGRWRTLAAVGRFADRWPQGRVLPAIAHRDDAPDFDGILQGGGAAFRAVAVPMTLDGGVAVGTLLLATAIDHEYAEQLDQMLRARVAIAADGMIIATTLPASAAREFETARAHDRSEQGTVVLDGSTYAFGQVASVGTAGFYAVSSIDEASSTAMRQTNRNLAGIAVGAIVLALAGSAWLANILTRPIEALSHSLDRIAASHDVHARVAPSGSSRELDALTLTFNTLMASVAEAEAQTEAAYASAIRALAAALDARDPYTAGHSERVSALSVSIGRALELGQEEIEVLRLGALLHDIGKIGVPDEVLRKPAPLSPAEFDAIKEHPGFGAKILRTVPFLSPHIPIVELHHERPDGRGYPYGLRGDEIPLLARVVHVADAYDAITSARAYRAGRSAGDALTELWRASGTEYDAEIVAVLSAVLHTRHSADDLVEVLSA